MKLEVCVSKFFAELVNHIHVIIITIIIIVVIFLLTRCLANHGLGGGMGTRMIGPQPLIFDHAAQFFAANASRFGQLVDAWLVGERSGAILGRCDWCA